MNKTLSNEEIEEIVGFSIPVITHRMMTRFSNIFEFFQESPIIMVLYEFKEKFGHWTGLLLHKDRHTIEYFDPYGDKPDEMKNYMPRSMWIGAILSRYLYDAALEGWKVEYNEMKLQKFAEGINTCGRWLAVRFYYRDIPLNTFQKFFKKFPNKDSVVVKLSDNIWQRK